MDLGKSDSPKTFSRSIHHVVSDGDYLESPSPAIEPHPFSRISPSMHVLETPSEYQIPQPPNPALEPLPNQAVPSLLSLPKPASSKEVQQLRSSLSPPYQSKSSADRNVDPLTAPTAVNSPISSPTNSIGSDLDYLLNKRSIDLKPLTFHKPDNHISAKVSPKSANNITMRRKNNRGSRHFRGRGDASGRGISNLSLIDIPIIDMSDDRPLRASKAGSPSK